ncbi:MAG: MATE family efflux transporter [Clostridiales bacterium]|nr:MATE family efflux transporter [Clostridiales bacterium]
MRWTCDLTQGNIRRGLIVFSLPLIAGNLLQQTYNIADTMIVGQFLGSAPLAAVGSAYTLMTLLTSILIGLCMGSGVVFSQLYGAKELERMRTAIANAFILIALLAIVLELAAYGLLEQIIRWLNIPDEVIPDIRVYLQIILFGILATFIYNFFAAALRSVGNSAVTLYFLLFSSLLNIGLDLLFVLAFHWGVAGAAIATVIAQFASAIGIGIYFFRRQPMLRPRRENLRLNVPLLRRISSVSLLTSVQQSIMNFGILMIQGLVNDFGLNVMAAFTAGVKIDSFAYSPAQDFANGFATYVAQNAGAGNTERVRKGIRTAALMSVVFCAVISVAVFLLAKPLLTIFIDPSEVEQLAIGAKYLRIEGACYIGIGMLMLFYAIFRGLERAGMSVILTVISLGTRVVLSYSLAPHLGLEIIWWSIPIGWFLADLVGLVCYRGALRKLKEREQPQA